MPPVDSSAPVCEVSSSLLPPPDPDVDAELAVVIENGGSEPAHPVTTAQQIGIVHQVFGALDM
jgi:hypothetical protein